MTKKNARELAANRRVVDYYEEMLEYSNLLLTLPKKEESFQNFENYLRNKLPRPFLLRENLLKLGVYEEEADSLYTILYIYSHCLGTMITSVFMKMVKLSLRRKRSLLTEVWRAFCYLVEAKDINLSSENEEKRLTLHEFVEYEKSIIESNVVNKIMKEKQEFEKKLEKKKENDARVLEIILRKKKKN